jgi:protease I
MNEPKMLSGRRIAVLAADGFEKVELSIPAMALRMAGAEVDIVSLRHGRIRGVNLHEPASRVTVTKTISEANPEDYDGLFIPGGFISPDLLRQSADAREFVRLFDAAQKPIATICHGPWVMASAGLLQGRTMTSWPGIRDDMVHAGAVWLDEASVRDGNLVSGRGPQDLVPFIRSIKELFADGAPVTRSETPARTISSPQRNQPPQLVLQVLKWMPRPSFRGAILALGALAFLMRPRRRRLAG